jgi:DHA1 family bicyclomycin/chloramphenicol resistance-like MFS transporter
MNQPTDGRLVVPGGLVVAVLTLLIALQPVTTDLYLPALPALRAHFNGSVSAVQLTLSVLMVSFGISQLVWGPVADRFGRRPVLLVGLTIYTVAAIVGALAPTMAILIAARAVQGIGMAAAMVCGRAMVRDLFEPHQGTHVMTQAMSVLAVISMSAPVFGAVLTSAWSWRAALLATAVFAAATLALIALRVPETVPQKQHNATRMRPLLSSYALIARHPSFITWTGLNSLGYAANFCFFSASSYVYIDTLGLSREAFGFVLGGASVAYLLGTFCCRRWIARSGVQASVRRAGWITLLAALVFLCPLMVHGHTTWTLTAGLWLHLFGYGILQPCGQVGLAAPFPRRAGSASALGGFAFALAAFLSSTWVGVISDGTALPVALTTGVLVAGCALVALIVVQRYGAVARSPVAVTP